MPDRLPSLVALVGFWVPPALAGWIAAGHLVKSRKFHRARITYATLAVVVVVYVAAWFLYNLKRMPPYIAGSTMDPSASAPEAMGWLAVVTAALILPGSAMACALAFGKRMRLDTERTLR